MVDAGNVTWNVVTLGAGISNDPELCDKYFEPIDEELVPNLANISPDLAAPCGVAGTLYGMTLVYNTQMFGDDGPTGWADFFDTSKFPGDRAVGNVPGFFDAPIAALLADGVAPEDLYPIDWDRATAKLDTIKDDLVFYESGGASEQILGAGEVAMAIVFSNRGYVAATAGAPYEPVWNQTFLHVTNFLIPKGAPSIEEAGRYINFAIEADIQGQWVDRNALGATNTLVDLSSDAEIRKWTPTAYPDDTFAIDEEYMATHLTENNERWLEWVTG
jgi:putative spermidine/putrescine transport system substrate-binding protein